jgi:regulatory protein
MNRELRARALRLLARRDHTRAELQAKLSEHATADEIAALLEEFERAGWLSDRRFVESYLSARRMRFGDFKLRHALRAKGVDEALIEQTLAGTDELPRAREVWCRKFAAAPADARDYARQARFLQSRGFRSETVRRLLREPRE